MVNQKIDKLTNSIENSITYERFDTLVLDVLQNEIIKSNWLFDWKKEINNPKREVYKLVTVGNENIIHGLISITDNNDHVFVNIIESSNFNRGKKKQYIGVAGNLFAFACKRSFELGHDGYVSFESKTSLVSHYKKSIGAKVIFGSKMVIETKESLILTKQYFK